MSPPTQMHTPTFTMSGVLLTLTLSMNLLVSRFTRSIWHEHVDISISSYFHLHSSVLLFVLQRLYSKTHLNCFPVCSVVTAKVSSLCLFCLCLVFSSTNLLYVLTSDIAVFSLPLSNEHTAVRAQIQQP